MTKNGKLTSDNTFCPAASDTRKVLLKAGFSASDADLFTERLTELLNDYTAAFGEGTKFQYTVWKNAVKVELRITIPGEKFDPFSEGDGAKKRTYENIFSANPDTGSSVMTYRYKMRCNLISIAISRPEKPKKLIKDPVIWGVILGIRAGLLCKILPADTSRFIVNDRATPIQSIILGLISGVMGPVLFFSLIASTGTLSSINDLTHLGTKVILRFIVSILFLIIVSILVSGFIFRNFGVGENPFSLSQLFTLLFDLVPTNLVDPFLKNNTAQLVILSFLCGAGLLMLGDSVGELKTVLTQISKWVMSVMRIILLLMPAIPFLSIMISIAGGKEKDLLSGWKFILASYIVFGLCTAVKAVKTSVKTGVSLRELWRLVKPVAKISFTTGSTTASIKRFYEVSEEDLHVKQSFSSFWIPMSSAMLSPKTAVNVVIAAFMAAQLENVPVSIAFLVVLIITTTELSIASPGIPAACTVMLKALGLPLNYVGLFTTYRLLTDNFGAACSISYSMLEEIEIAHKLDAIETGEPASPEESEIRKNDE